MSTLSTPSVVRLRSRLRVALAGGGCGIAGGGLLAYDALFQYGTVPFANAIFALPLVGVVLYWWTDGLRERLFAVGLQTLVAGGIVIVAFSIPLGIIEAPTMAERTLLLANAIARGLVLGMLGSFLTAIGLITAIGIDREVLAIDRSSLTLWLRLGVTAVVITAGVGLADTATQNYGSAVDQRAVTIELAEPIEREGAEYVLTLLIPNRLSAPLSIESVLLSIDRPGQDRLSVQAFPTKSIPARSRGTVSIPFRADRLVSADRTTDPTVTVAGFVYTTAFNGYRARHDLEPTVRRLDIAAIQRRSTAADQTSSSVSRSAPRSFAFTRSMGSAPVSATFSSRAVSLANRSSPTISP